MKEKIKITITLTDDNIVLYGENTQDLTEDASQSR
jgi:VCBS repeat-containing protein